MTSRHRQGGRFTVYRSQLITGSLLIHFFGMTQLVFGSDAPVTIHTETVNEIRTIAQDALTAKNADSLSLALVDSSHGTWTQAFGVANKKTQISPSEDTMYGIGSVSKMFTAVAVMKLVDEGKVSLDTPVISYLPSFHTRSLESNQITVRMLLNHSSGLPGTDERNIMTTIPFLTYAEQLLFDLANQRLIYSPGYMSVYTNNGFTLVESLIQQVSGQSYVNYVQDEIFNPLGMTHTRFPTSFFPEDAFARTSRSGNVDPQEFINAYGTGGIYSTPSDMARFALMFINQGILGTTRILSEEAVAEMARAQTENTFNPVPSEGARFGLGWDSVMQPGLSIVHLPGWTKGGDTNAYGSALIIAPSERLAAMVMGTAGISSTVATGIAEQVILHELAARGRIPEVPPKLSVPLKPAVTATEEQLEKMRGFWAKSGSIMQIQSTETGSLELKSWNGKQWESKLKGLQLRTDGWFTSEASLQESLRQVNGDGREYLAVRTVSGYGEYLDQQAFAQKIAPKGELSPAWKARLDRNWLVVNQTPDFPTWAQPYNPRLNLLEVKRLEGLLVASITTPLDTTPEESSSTSAKGQSAFYVLDPSYDDQHARTMLLIPTFGGRDIDDIDVFTNEREEWLRFGDLIYRPSEMLPVVYPGQQMNFTIGPEGYAEWLSLHPSDSTTQVILETEGAWKVFGPHFVQIASGRGNATVSIPQRSATYYVMLFGTAGNTMRVNFKAKDTGSYKIPYLQMQELQ